MFYKFRCKCGQIRTTMFAFGPCKHCGTDATIRVEEDNAQADAQGHPEDPDGGR
jgi:hypothetical protein